MIDVFVFVRDLICALGRSDAVPSDARIETAAPDSFNTSALIFFPSVVSIAVASCSGASFRFGKNTASRSAAFDARSAEAERFRLATPWSVPTEPNLWHDAQLASNAFRPASTSSTCCGWYTVSSNIS